MVNVMIDTVGISFCISSALLSLRINIYNMHIFCYEFCFFYGLPEKKILPPLGKYPDSAPADYARYFKFESDFM